MRAPIRAALAVLALLAAGLVALAPAPAAQAANGCGGSFLKSYVYADGFAQVDVYLEDGTTNCLVNRTRGDSWGKARWMGVGVGKGRYYYTCPRGHVSSGPSLDCGRYQYYAGPVRVRAADRCINFWAGVVKGNGTFREMERWGVHCG